MRPDLNGKILLIIAGSIHEYDLVRRAKELGVYTIVTDYYDTESSPAKKIADEYWDISWEDLDTLEAKCREKHIDGITAGYSESTVDRCIKLCERLGLPCYCTQEQLDILKDKKLFKDACRKYGVPVVHEYESKEEVTRYPVIIKPVDRGGSIGVGIANNPVELDEVYSYAMKMSYSDQVIIEDYINWGNKFDAYYAITNGNISFLSTSDTINSKGNGFDKVVQSGWTLPSRYEKEYLEQVDSSIRRMITGLGIENGFFFFSGFSDGDRFVFFETGFRLSGGHMYRYFEANGMPDVQDIFIQHALTGNCDGIVFSAKTGTKKALIINYYAREGTLTSLKGIEEIQRISECGYAIPMCKLGTVCHQDKAILNKIGMVHLYSENGSTLLDDLETVNDLFIASDENGKDIVFDRMSVEEVALAWGQHDA